MTNGYDTHHNIADAPGWLERFEHIQEIQNKQLGELASSVSALTATVGTLDSQQKALFGRANRPYPWGAFIGAATLLVIGAGLLITPMKEADAKLHAADIRSQKHAVMDAREMGVVQENLRWLNRLEERTNERLHTRRKIEGTVDF